MKTETATQSDFDALTALNSDYIHSVQNSDVQRFDEILAEDSCAPILTGRLSTRTNSLLRPRYR